MISDWQCLYVQGVCRVSVMVIVMSLPVSVCHVQGVCHVSVMVMVMSLPVSVCHVQGVCHVSEMVMVRSEEHTSELQSR